MKKPAKTQDERATDDVQRWNTEFAAAKKELEKWHKLGGKIVDRFRDDRPGETKDGKRWNLFSANVQTQMAVLYGQVPKVDVSRRFDDSNDDVARVAGEILERVLNCDIEEPTDAYADALWEALQDRMLPGFGMVRVRLERDERQVEAVEAVVDEATGLELAPAVPETTELEREEVVVDYVPWLSHLWSPARTFHEVRWWAFEALMSRRQLVERFGEKLGRRVPLNKKSEKSRGGESDKPETPWGRASVWEIWDKEAKKVHWYVEGFPQLLESKADTLQLKGFWPFPKPMVANLTTKTLVPVPDYKLAQDLYNEIDQLTTRISLLTDAVAVRGVYDKTNTGLKRLLSEANGNELIPVDSFAAFMEKGGIAGAIAWMPLDQVVAAIVQLGQQRAIAEEALYQVTGMSDIVRGQATAGEAKTATEQSIKAKFGSVRMSALQKEFARFASDTQRVKAEVMAKWFSPETLLEKSNILQTPDAELAPAAVELIKSKYGLYRVEVKPDSVSLEDFAAKRSEAAEFVEGVSRFIQAAAPLAEKLPGATPMLLELLQLVATRFKFADEAEGILDRAISAAEQQAAAPQPAQAPDPKVVAQQLKTQGELQKTQLDHQARMQEIAAETQAEASKQAMQAHFDTQQLVAKTQLEVEKAHALPKPVVKPGVAR